MSFADLKSQMEQLPHDEMVRALAFLKSRLRANNAANRNELARRHAEMDAGRKVKWEDLKQQLGLTGVVVAYSLVLHEEAAHRLVSASRGEQRRLSVILEELKLSPFRKGDLRELDANDRVNEIMVEGDGLVTFWVDHAVREIRVVRIESSEDGS